MINRVIIYCFMMSQTESKASPLVDRTQLLIVRQCCVKAAAELASMRPVEWKETAAEMEKWVLR